MNKRAIYIYELSEAIKDGTICFDVKYKIKDIYKFDRDFKKHLITARLVENDIIELGNKEIISTICNGNFVYQGDDLFEINNIGISGDNIGLQIGCEYNYAIYVHIDVPLCIDGNDALTGKYIEAEIVNFNILLSRKELPKRLDGVKNKLYETYHEYGFILADIEKLNNFLLSKKARNNLIEEFTTTELASDLFSKGIMVLCWGLTPWPYYISSETDKTQRLGDKTSFTGDYIFDSSISNVSVIPGEALIDWESCRKKEWPKLQLDDSQNGVKISLYLEEELAVEDRFMAGFTSPIPTFYIERVNISSSDDVKPLLDVQLFK